MDNFFNYVTKPVNPEDVDVWFRANNIIPEKLELFSDFSLTLYHIIKETYLGDEDSQPNETKIVMDHEDNSKHFLWCWNKTIENFEKEEIKFNHEGDHFEYFKDFFDQIFYEQKEKKIKESIEIFFNETFNINRPFTKSDLDMISTIYKNLDRNLNI